MASRTLHILGAGFRMTFGILRLAVIAIFIWLLALILAAFGQKQFLGDVKAILRRWHIFAPITIEERMANLAWRVEWHYRLYCMSVPQMAITLIKRIFWRQAMTHYLSEKIEKLKNAVGTGIIRFARQDDLGMVLSLTGLLDEYFALIIASRFGALVTQRSWERAFEGDGPLGRFSAKISMASVLGLVVGDMAHDLPILKKIRNDFAHAIEPQSLSNDPHRARCNSLRLSFPVSDEIMAACKSKERQKFFQCAVAILMHQTAVLNWVGAERLFVMQNQDEINRRARETMPGIPKDQAKARPEAEVAT